MNCVYLWLVIVSCCCPEAARVEWIPSVSPGLGWATGNSRRPAIASSRVAVCDEQDRRILQRQRADRRVILDDYSGNQIN